MAANLEQCSGLLLEYLPATRLLFLSLFHAYNLPLRSARSLWKTLLQRAQRKITTTRTFASGCPSSMLGVDGASGEAGDRRLSSKRKSKGCDAPPALDDAENPTPSEEPPAAAAAPTAAAAVDAAAAAS